MNRINKGILFVYQIFQNRWFQPFFFFLALIFIIYFIWTNSADLMNAIHQIELNPGDLFKSLALITGTVLLGGISWHFITLGFGKNSKLLININIYFRATLTKYIPGFVWQYLSKGHFIKSLGMSPTIIPWVLAWDFLQILWSGVLIIILMYFNIQTKSLKIFGHPDLYYLFLFLFVLVGFPTVFFLFFNHKNKSTIMDEISPSKLIFSSIILFLGWIIMGASLKLALDAFGFSNSFNVFECVFIYASAVISGIAVVFIPNGIGVREGVMAYLLSGEVPIYTAIVIGTYIRVAIAFVELLLGCVSLLTTKFFKPD